MKCYGFLKFNFKLLDVTLELCIWYNWIFDLEMDNKKKSYHNFFIFIIIIFLK